MRIPCVHCGERGSDEFVYLGDAGPVRPDRVGSIDAGAISQWADYVYLRDNPAGSHRELWQHVAGCRAWLVVTRDTRSHGILGVQSARAVALARAETTAASERGPASNERRP